jgi:hypothetical protein
MRIRLDIALPLIGIALVIGYDIAGYFDGMFLPRQIIAKWGQPGVALIFHGGMWGDLILLPFLFAYLIGKVSGDWTATHVGYALLIGFAVTFSLQLMLALTGDKPDPMGWQGERWSLGIALHFTYMWGAVTLVALTLLYSPSATAGMITVTCIIIGIHTYLGAQILFGILNRCFFRWDLVPEMLITAAFVTQAIVWAVLAGLAARVGGMRAGALVLSVGTALWLLMYVVSHLTEPVQSVSH